MECGGVILGAGMVLELAEGEYLYGQGRVRFTVGRIVETRQEWECEWVVLEGMEKAPSDGPWRPRRLQVRVDALPGALALVTSP